MRWETVTFERLSLYEKVWSTPVSRLAKQFGLSDVGLRKICKRLGVPMAALGYWTKIEHGGRSLPKPPLPRFAGETTYVHRRRIDDGAIAMQHKVDAALGARELLPEPSVVLGDDPAEFHALVKRTARAMRKPRSDDRGLQVSWRPNVFQISVSPKSAPRALRILDALWTALTAIGGKPAKRDDNAPWLHVELDGEKLGLQLHESLRRHDRPLTSDEKCRLEKNGLTYIPDRYSWEPTGRLNLTILSSTGAALRRLRDGHEKLEAKLAEAVNAYRRAAVEQHIAREEAAAAARKFAEVERIRTEKAQVADRELRRLRTFESLAKQLERAQRLRHLADTLDKAGVVLVVRNTTYDEEKSEAKLGQVAWLRGAADWLDPTMRADWPEVDEGSSPHWWLEYQREMGAPPSWY
jgi:hypothetical protein